MKADGQVVVVTLMIVRGIPAHLTFLAGIYLKVLLHSVQA